MALRTFKPTDGIIYEATLFSEEDIRDLLEVWPSVGEEEITLHANGLAPLPAEGPHQELAAADEGTDQEVDAEDVHDALAEALEFLKQDSDFAAELAEVGEENVVGQVHRQLLNALVEDKLDENIAARNAELRGTIDLVFEPGFTTLRVEGRTMLQADLATVQGQALDRVLAIAWVLIDFIFVIAAAVNVAVLRGSQWAQQVKDMVLAVKKDVVTMMTRYIDRIKAYLPSWRGSTGGALARQIKEGAKAIASGIGHSLKYAYDHKLLSLLKKICALLFAGSLVRKVASVLSLIGGIIAAVASFGVSIGFAIANLCAQLLFLAGDSIRLFDVFSQPA